MDKIMTALFLSSALILVPVEANANCTYMGKTYQTFDSVSVVDPKYRDDVKKYNYTPDGVSMAMICMPTIDISKVENNEFSVTEIPATVDSWVPSEVIYAFNKPTIRYK